MKPSEKIRGKCREVLMYVFNVSPEEAKKTDVFEAEVWIEAILRYLDEQEENKSEGGQNGEKG